MQEVVITGIGFVLPGCGDRETFWGQLADGRSQLALEPDPIRPGHRRAVGRATSFDPEEALDGLPRRLWDRWPREILLYLGSLVRAAGDAGMGLDALAGAQVGLFDGCARPGFQFWSEKHEAAGGGGVASTYGKQDIIRSLPGQAAGIGAAIFRVQGPAHTFTSTCASGAVAIGHAAREIALGEIDVALAGGHESSLAAPLFQMYRDAGLLSMEEADPRRAVAPYERHSGNAFSEGAVTLVLESRAHAEARGARVLARLAGYRYGNNGAHPTAVDDTGERPAAVVRQLLDRARVPLADVGVVVGHGNGVRASDESETAYMKLLFGERVAEVPLVSTKPVYGHTLGASSAVNVAAAALMVEHDFIIPTANVAAGLHAGVSHQGGTGRARTCPAAVAMSYGMGGHNAAVAVAKA